jgi:hypothetical protein
LKVVWAINIDGPLVHPDSMVSMVSMVSMILQVPQVPQVPQSRRRPIWIPKGTSLIFRCERDPVASQSSISRSRPAATKI